MKNHFTLALNRELRIRNQIAAETFRPGKVAEMRLAINAGCLDRFEANADAGVVDRLAADGIVVEVQDDSLLGRIAGAYVDDEADEREKRDRLIILPTRGDCGDDDTVDELTEHDANGEA